MLWVIVLFFAIAIGWASWAEIDKVTVGQGKVIPRRKSKLYRTSKGASQRNSGKRGPVGTKGQQLLLIDDTRFRSDYREREQQVANLTAAVLQLTASIDSVEIDEEFTNAEWEKAW